MYVAKCQETVAPGELQEGLANLTTRFTHWIVAGMGRGV